MANYLCTYAVPDSVIDYFRAHPEFIYDYVCAREPDKAPKKFPDAWPKRRLKTITGNYPNPEVNHRNVDLYHRLLNGTGDPVKGSGSIFQTWFGGKHDAIVLGSQEYAFKSGMVPGLLELVEKVTVEQIRIGFRAWDKASKPSDEDCESYLGEFDVFAKGLKKAIKEKKGLVWVSM